MTRSAQRKRAYRWLGPLLLGIGLVLLGSCQSKPASTDETAPMDDTRSTDDTSTLNEPDSTAGGKNLPYVAPLTGEPTATSPDRRAFMVIIENSPAARPQSGLNQADVVYEVLVEGGITRFAAFFQSMYPKTVGPVRSIRPYFIQLATGYDAVMAHAGGSPEALRTIANQGLPSLNGVLGEADPYFWRSQFRKRPHNLYTDFDHLNQMSEKKKMRMTGNLPGFRFDDEPLKGGSGASATTIDIRYNADYRVGFAYDAQTKQYARSINGQPHTDLESGEVLTATNVLVIAAKHRVLDNEGRLAIDLSSGGQGTFFTRGRAVPVSWQNVQGIIRAYTEDRAEVAYAPGRTWVEIVPDVGATVTYQGDASR